MTGIDDDAELWVDEIEIIQNLKLKFFFVNPG